MKLQYKEQCNPKVLITEKLGMELSVNRGLGILLGYKSAVDIVVDEPDVYYFLKLDTAAPFEIVLENRISSSPFDRCSIGKLKP